MKVELTEHPKGNQRFEILLGGVVHVIRLDQGKQLADWIYELHPTYKVENEALKECVGFFASVIKSGEPWTYVCQEKLDALLTKKDEGFFCPKCGTVYESGVMACQICNPIG